MKNVLIKPLITEKLTADAEKYNRYGFIVDQGSNKIEIKKAVESSYGVKVTAVRTINVDGKKRSRYTKAGMVTGRTNSYKKAIVQLAEGDMIDFYDNI
ncbi:50S ribosomal protein L23 [Sanyastnella coralliicola]|jgi:large subunit ribosomal protein L23|uniref:50S ribosomal protein L23 n=1 Tax=Sanyastnella coralliicola TaxID=3069118 RepID=UPI0027BA9CB2|nr:50S ribosomal protein L23 [Longitalea sp. SCSIO 12813]